MMMGDLWWDWQQQAGLMNLLALLPLVLDVQILLIQVIYVHI
jgi:hypothetical protein